MADDEINKRNIMSQQLQQLIVEIDTILNSVLGDEQCDKMLCSIFENENSNLDTEFNNLYSGQIQTGEYRYPQSRAPCPLQEQCQTQDSYPLQGQTSASTTSATYDEEHDVYIAPAPKPTKCFLLDAMDMYEGGGGYGGGGGGGQVAVDILNSVGNVTANIISSAAGAAAVVLPPIANTVGNIAINYLNPGGNNKTADQPSPVVVYPSGGGGQQPPSPPPGQWVWNNGQWVWVPAGQQPPPPPPGPYPPPSPGPYPLPQPGGPAQPVGPQVPQGPPGSGGNATANATAYYGGNATANASAYGGNANATANSYYYPSPYPTRSGTPQRTSRGRSSSPTRISPQC